MKAVVIILVVVLLAVGLGWITFHRNGDHASLDVNTAVIKSDANKVEEKAQEGARKVSEAGRKAVDEVKRTDIDVDVRRRPAEPEVRPVYVGD